MAFFNSAITVLQTLVVALGAGLGIWGAINLLEGYGNDNPGAKSQGMKQLMAGGGVALMSETFLFMREKHIESFEDLYEKTDAAVARFNDLSSRIKAAESQMAANLALQKHIQNYAKTRDIYETYRKSGYSKKGYSSFIVGNFGIRTGLTWSLRQRDMPAWPPPIPKIKGLAGSPSGYHTALSM